MSKRLSKAKINAIARRRALSEWSLAVKELHGSVCMMCRATEKLNCHHILPKNIYKVYQYDTGIGIVLCAGCHQFRANSPHQNGFLFTHWLKNTYPKIYRYCYKRMKL